MRSFILTVVLALVAVGSLAAQPEAEVRLAAANAAARQVEAQPEASTEPVKALFRGLLAGARGPLLLRATNDYGVFLLRRALPEEALQVFSSLEIEAHKEVLGDPSVRARFFYNFARCLEAAGRWAEASPRYLEAVRLDGTFTDARDAAFANVQELATRFLASPFSGIAAFPSPLANGVALCNLLLERGDLVDAAGLLRVLAATAGRSPQDAAMYLEALVPFLTATRTRADEFEKIWSPLLVELPSPRRVADLRAAYSSASHLPLALRPREASAVFAGWTDASGRPLFSALLKVIGDALSEQKLHAPALQRYALAFGLDPTNVDAALYVTNLLLSYPAELDPQAEIVEQWTQALLDSKLEASAREAGLDVLRLHTLLAAIFERAGRVGPETDPRAASFHWLRALAAQEEVASRNPEPYPAPVLHEKMAKYYASTGRSELAREQFMASSAEFQTLGEADRAMEAREAGLKIGEQLATSQGEKPLYKLHLISGEEFKSKSREAREIDDEVLSVAKEAFLATRRFKIIEHSQLNTVFTEKSLQDFIGGKVNNKLTDALDLDLIGVVGHTAESTKSDKGEALKTWIIDVRLIDAQTATLLATVTSDASLQSMLLPHGTPREAGVLLAQSIREEFPPLGFVIQIHGKDVIVDLGTEAGVKQGDRLEVVQQGEQIIHPVTGQVLAAPLKVIGELKVVTASAQLATCKRMSGSRELPLASLVRLKGTGTSRRAILSWSMKALLKKTLEKKKEDFKQ